MHKNRSLLVVLSLYGVEIGMHIWMCNMISYVMTRY